MNLGSRPGHSYALLPSAARQLASLAFRSSHAFGEHMEAIAVGMMPGLVCARCGMTIFEIIAADVLCIETSPLSSTECLARKTAVRSMLECDLAGTPPYVCV
ncbi:MAG TPA: hypothetical protein VM537_11600, partial [Anaerolineae bacterium]|nr:hypothetical protein [Anaerolineae bacterium]